ncbi:MAG: catalase [Ruminiclostridium sp.]
MQQKNGWFQLESQLPVRNSNPESREIPSRQTVTEPKLPRQDEVTNNYSGNITSGQKPHFGNMSSYSPQPQSNPPLQEYPDFTATPQPNTVSERKSSTPQGNFINEPLGALSSAGKMKQNSAAPIQKTPSENMMGNHYKSQSASPSWENDRVLNTLHSQTVGKRGPVLEQDSVLHETLETFVHTKLLERPVHVKGFGAFGTFQAMHSMREYTKLSFLQTPGQQVPVMVRFSLAAGNKGTPDTSRNVRGFSTKFYTQEGIFDLLCNHIPVLFVRDGIRFPEAFTSLAPSPINNLTDPERFWKFVARAPEATHFVTWLYSDVGTIKSLRHIRGFGVNTYVWRNADGVRRYVKYHWIPLAGEEYIDRQEAAMLAGMNLDVAGQDLYDTIAAGTPVQYELRVQLMNPQDESSLSYDPLDCTKVWDEQRYPMLPVGLLTLNRNPNNYMEQVEKVAFSPTNLLDGAELSDDKLLQARANIYWDSQRHRLGQDFRSIPVNHQENWSPDEQLTSGIGRHVEGQLVRSELPNPDNFSQAGQRYLSLSSGGQNHLVDNLAADLAIVSTETQSVVLGYLNSASAELGQRVSTQIAIYARR